MNKYMEEADSLFINTYLRSPIVLDRGEGVYLYDTDGKKYLDFAAGIAVFAFGYGNKEYNNALKSQIDKLIHTSNLYYNVPVIDAAEKFIKASGMDRVFFTSSGTESIEGAIKLAKKYAYKKTGHGNHEIISMKHSFHGRSLGALSVTGQPKYQKPFEPMLDGVVLGEFNHLESVKELVNEKTCAILVEPIQGEGGIYPAAQEFLEGLRKICNDNDILLIFDEIQCGMGRTGDMFAYEGYGVKPDIITSAKALGCGIPVGAFAAVTKAAEAFEPGDHGTTYGGNPLAGAAVSKVLDLFESLHILDNVNEVGVYLEKQLDTLADKYDCIIERRGKGLMQGLEFNRPVKEYIDMAGKKGLIIISAGMNVIRFVPPLIITKENVDEMVEILEDCINKTLF